MSISNLRQMESLNSSPIAMIRKNMQKNVAIVSPPSPPSSALRVIVPVTCLGIISHPRVKKPDSRLVSLAKTCMETIHQLTLKKYVEIEGAPQIQTKKPKFGQAIVAAALSGFLTTSFCQPIDNLLLKLQTGASRVEAIQQVKTNPMAGYRLSIIRVLAAHMSFMTAKSALTESAHQLTSNQQIADGMGIVGASYVQAVVTSPINAIVTQQVMSKEKQSCMEILKNKRDALGRFLFAGTTLTGTRNTVYWGGLFTFRSTICDRVKQLAKKEKEEELSPAISTIATGAASTLASFGSLPFDILAKGQRIKPQSSIISVTREIISRPGGIKNLWKGFGFLVPRSMLSGGAVGLALFASKKFCNEL